MRAMKNRRILIGLVIVISAIVLIVLLSGCVQKPPQEIQDQTTPTPTPTPTPTTSTTIQKSELSKEIDEINLMVEDFENLSNSVDELDENEDLLQVFKGD